MEHTIAKKLSDSKEVQAFISHVKIEIEMLDKIGEINTDNPEVLALEIKARKIAHDKLIDILEPLLDISDLKVNFSNKEYIT